MVKLKLIKPKQLSLKFKNKIVKFRKEILPHFSDIPYFRKYSVTVSDTTNMLGNF